MVVQIAKRIQMGDGVTDDLDQCPDTQSGETVDANGCSDSQKDSDGDGVTDDLDQCPGTSPNVVVDAERMPYSPNLLGCKRSNN